MPPSAPKSLSGNIAITVMPQPSGGYTCEMTSTLEGQAGATKRFNGQNANHAIAICLENLAHKFRMEAEAEQSIDWEAVDRSPSGIVIEKRFHVILHYEDVTEDESKFEAMHGTLLGNTVIENAGVSVIQIDPDLPIEPLER